MQRKTIEAVYKAKTKTGSEYFKIFFTDKTMASTFNADQAIVLYACINNEIDVELVENNGFLNLKGFDTHRTDIDTTDLMIPTEPPKKSFSGGGKADPAKLTSIERTAVAKMVMGYYGARDIELNEKRFVSTADMVYKWVSKR